MRDYSLIAAFALLLVLVQLTVQDVVFAGQIGVELSLLAVIFAGLTLPESPGGWLSFLLGIFYDSLIGMTMGLFSLLYLCVFLLVRAVSYRISTESVPALWGLTLLCVFAKDLLVFLFYRVVLGIDLSHYTLTLFLPEALLLTVVSPLLFPRFATLRRFLKWSN
jgi:rod shape-determining protein MreD